ncbi:MAG TPA: HAMP domain-containing sensor histidine kinase [Gemmatimonadaceae bacterium]
MATQPSLDPRPPVGGEARVLPLALVIVALALLLVTPIVVDWRIRTLQHETDERSQARLVLNELEAAAIAQVLIAERSRATGRPDTLALATARANAKTVVRDESELDSLLASAHYTRKELAEIQAIDRSWRIAREANADTTDTLQARVDPLVAFNAAEMLDDRLTQQLDSTRLRSRALQRINVLSAAVLTPIALFSVLVVFVAGRRARMLAHHLERERTALAQSIEARAGLVRGITHDLKNPLGAAAGYTDLMLEGIGGSPLSADHAEMLQRIRKLLHQSVDSIASLVTIADDGGITELKLEFQPTDLAALTRDVMDDYRAAAIERRLTLHGPAGDTSAPLITDVRHVQHILGNLLSNAVKYTPRGGRVVVQVFAANDNTPRCRVEVRDSGPGIPPALRKRIFEEFFRANGIPDEVRGNGVGLSISRRLARQLGGDINVSEAPEGGANFALVLPTTGRRDMTGDRRSSRMREERGD